MEACRALPGNLGDGHPLRRIGGSLAALSKKIRRPSNQRACLNELPRVRPFGSFSFVETILMHTLNATATLAAAISFALAASTASAQPQQQGSKPMTKE